MENLKWYYWEAEYEEGRLFKGFAEANTVYGKKKAKEQVFEKMCLTIFSLTKVHIRSIKQYFLKNPDKWKTVLEEGKRLYKMLDEINKEKNNGKPEVVLLGGE